MIAKMSSLLVVKNVNIKREKGEKGVLPENMVKKRDAWMY